MAQSRFKALQNKIEGQGESAGAAAAIAAAAGRKKNGKAGMAKMAAEGKKRAAKGK